MKEKQLQQIIAESMYAGSLLADKNYGGEINSNSNKSFVNSILKLKDLVQEFTAHNNLGNIDLDAIFPLHKEIENVLKH
jgi:hypothetical protein